MTIEQAIYAQLNDGDVATLAGNRISPEWRREGTALPAVIYTVDSREPVTKLSGKTALARLSVSITSIASTMAAARELAAAVADQVTPTIGSWPTHYSTTVTHARMTSEDVERMNDLEGTDDGPRSVTQRYDLWATGA